MFLASCDTAGRQHEREVENRESWIWAKAHWQRKSLASSDTAGLAGNVTLLVACSITPSLRMRSCQVQKGIISAAHLEKLGTS